MLSYTVVLLFLVTMAMAANQYVIERSLDDGNSWQPRGSVVVTGATANAAKAKFSPITSTEGVALSETERKNILEAERIFFRVVETDKDDAKKEKKEVARAVTTPCSLIRGFNLKSKTEVELIESLNVVVTKSSGNQNAVTGLQFVPRTNLHHSSNAKYSNHGDVCDHEVLKLFPTLTVSTTVGVARTTVPKRTPKFEESLYFAGAAEDAAKQQQAQAAAQQAQNVNAEGKPVDAEGKVIPEPDNRSFFEKYWHYILMFVVWNLIQTFIKGNDKAKADGAAVAAAPGAKK